ncbi:MAG: choice-of-anchor tandem repeat GloVer-containing protein [Bryobacteraceae bacterium]
MLYGFTDGSEGVYPSGVTADAAGNLYGTTLEGGEYGTGAVFKLSRSGQVTVLHTFGQYGRPSGVILDAAGSLYGGAQDLIYKLDPAGNLTALAEFDGVPSELVRDTSGNLYFTSGAPGSVYKLETNGNLKSLYVSRGLL